ncbi:uncharacterized protein LOC132289503 [Cornus florida]|uniref:uncharacterized protein LOC132289503 n=1 Tax=Cornus florida TaxID=4283 RepID=UPI00289F5590|nr:uncharacterized protein LOC132289503 [Cornus florida]
MASTAPPETGTRTEQPQPNPQGQPQSVPYAYPAPPPYPGYPYAAPPPAAYYTTTRPYAVEHQYHVFSRVMCMIMITFLIGMIFLLIIPLLVFGKYTSEFQVETLSVPSFNVSDTSLKANWEAKVKVKNVNEKSDAYYYHVESSINYKDSILAVSLVNPFRLGKKDTSNINVELASKAEHSGMEDKILKEIGKDRSGGAVTFNLKFGVVAVFSSGIWKREARMSIVCDDLKVNFGGGNGAGTLSSGEHKCVTYI